MTIGLTIPWPGMALKTATFTVCSAVLYVIRSQRSRMESHGVLGNGIVLAISLRHD